MKLLNLKPCPKCRMVDQLHPTTSPTLPEIKWAITCLNCGERTENFPSLQEARTAWDNRQREDNFPNG